VLFSFWVDFCFATVFIFHFNLKDTTTHTCLILNMDYRKYYCWWFSSGSFLKKELRWKKGILSMGPISEEKEEALVEKTAFDKKNCEKSSLQLATSLPNPGFPQCCQTPCCKNRINQKIGWSSIDSFVDLLMIRSKDCLLYHGLVSYRQSRKPKLI